MNFEKVKIVGAQGLTSRAYESDLKKEAKYLNCELAGFRARGQGNQGRNYYNDRYEDRRRKCDSDWRWKKDYKDKKDRYIPLGSQDTESRMEAMLTKLVKRQESQKASFKEIKVGISGLI